MDEARPKRVFVQLGAGGVNLTSAKSRFAEENLCTSLALGFL